jgi:hypothetical protein
VVGRDGDTTWSELSGRTFGIGTSRRQTDSNTKLVQNSSSYHGRKMQNIWTCSRCGEVHQSTPGYSFGAPWPWYGIPEHQRHDCELSDNFCALFDQDFFVRGCIEIPVLGGGDPLIWGVWVSLSKENFERQKKMLSNPARIDEPPQFGWLCSRIQVFPDTLLLKTRVHSRPVGTRPYIELEPTQHPIAVEQRNGISQERVREIAELM